MLIQIDHQQYMIRFSRQSVYTHAELFKIENNNLKSPIDMGLIGISECSKKDIFKKSTGRKVALAKLIDEIEKKLPSFGMNKVMRTYIWLTYFETHKK